MCEEPLEQCHLLVHTTMIISGHSYSCYKICLQRRNLSLILIKCSHFEMEVTEPSKLLLTSALSSC